MNLNSVLIGSENPQRLADYYTKLFGAPVMGDGSGYTTWVLGNGAVTVGPHDQVKGKSTAPGRVIWNVESDDVKGDAGRFTAAGANVVAAPYKPDEAGEYWIATFADPDDNYFQLVSPFNPEMG